MTILPLLTFQTHNTLVNLQKTNEDLFNETCSSIESSGKQNLEDPKMHCKMNPYKSSGLSL